MRALLVTLLLLVLFILDAWITSYLVVNFDGQELNPYLNTTSFMKILLAPTHFLSFGIAVICLAYAEKNRSKMKIYFTTYSIKLWPFFFPFYLIIMKFLAVVNNLFPLFEKTTPIYWLRIPFRAFSDDPFTQLTWVYAVAAVLLAPLLIYIAKVLYQERTTEESSISDDQEKITTEKKG